MTRVSFKTLGCRLNQAETARLAAQVERAGCAVVPWGESADVCVIHTCAITAAAERKSLAHARAARKRPGSPRVVLAGCAVDFRGPDLLRASGADIAVPNSRKFHLPGILRHGRLRAPRGTPAESDIVPRFETTRAVVKAQDGCNFGCAYCVVPMLRGTSSSRPADAIVAEIRAIGNKGYREVVLTGANLGSYRDGDCGLAELLRRIEMIRSIRRIRLSSIELSTAERAVIDFMASRHKICRYLHLPLQSGDDRILAAMGRRYTSSDYRKLVEYALSKLGPPGLGADIIAGLPGEDDRAFESTLRIVEDLPFSNLHVFPFSPRPGTRAASMPDQVPHARKMERAAILARVAARKAETFARGMIGGPASVLVERVLSDGTAKGWTEEYVEASIPARPDTQWRQNDIIEFVPSEYTNCRLAGVDIVKVDHA